MSARCLTQADLDSGKIKYQHNGSEAYTDSFKYLVKVTAIISPMILTSLPRATRNRFRLRILSK